MGAPLYRDRVDAGRVLGRLLAGEGLCGDVLVLALPRGGVPVGFTVACILKCDLDVLVARKIGAPGQEELAVGAVASGGVRVVNDPLLRYLHLDSATVDKLAALELQELTRRETFYREGRPGTPIQDRTVILTDDGLATGATMLAAIRSVRSQNPREIIVAVPVASREACREIAPEVSRVISVATPFGFNAVGAWYSDFSQTTDEEVTTLLERARLQRCLELSAEKQLD